MRPHSLRLSAFGPFAGTVSVDLDALADAGLFLLHGQTGAGKTTLLDGIGFALFGRVPGVRNGARRLRSDHASVGTRTEVQLVATCGERRLRITRSPAWDRPKARGTGTTTEPAKVLLEHWVRDGWETLSTRAGEADQEIADAVGMSAEQFFQVVLLPQGDFAQFLRADSAKRAEVLQKLFATERFADVEGWLAHRRRETAERAAAGRQSVSRVLAQLTEAAGLTVEVDEGPVPAEGECELTWARGLLTAAAAESEVAAAAVQRATAARDAARLEADAVTRRAGLQHRRRDALARKAALDLALPQRQALQAEVDAAQRAAEVAGVLQEATARRRGRDDGLVAEAQARTALQRIGVDPDLDAVALRGLVAGAQEQAGRCEALRVVDASARQARDEALDAQAEEAEALAAVAAMQMQLAALPERRAEAGVAVDRAREAALAWVPLQATRDQLAALRPDVIGLAHVVVRVAQLDEQQLSARETALALESKALELRVANVNSMVARLAFALEDGLPCEVCGSTVHPDPSRLRDEGVGAEQEEHARRDAEAAQSQVQSLQERLAAERATADGLRARVGAWTLAGLDERLAGLDLELDVLAATAAGLDAAEHTVAEVDALKAELGTVLVAASERASSARRRAGDATARAQEAQHQLVTVLGPEADVEAALARAAALLTTTSVAADAVEALAAAQTELSRAVTAAESACAAGGFATVEDATAAWRDADWRSAAVTELRAAADLDAAVAAELADPALDVELDPPAPVDAATEALAAADAVLAPLLEELGERRNRESSLQRLVPALEQQLTALAPLEQRSREVRALADLCAGQGANGLRMTLSSFVLAARLEEVAEAASVRLLRMTQGRYSLVHTDGSARGGARSGLGLLARDGWSGQDRDTATLSGGETFLASLALALGLADVVAAEAGGSRIGALFVDEGFGTLDEDALDEVMDVLDGLREGGRVVGVVSHVAELRQRIPAQVEVTKTRTGSDVVLHGV